ncbi:MAG: AraC family transcriptional regulator, partial [Bacteroidota bacterium]
MKTRLHGSDLQDLSIEIEHPRSFETEGEPLTEREYNANHLLIEGSYKEIFFEGVHIGYGDFRLPRPALVYFDTEMETIEMHFALQGRARTQADCFAKEVGFETNQHNLIYASEFKGAIEWCAEKDMKVFEVNLWPSFF